MDIFKNRTIRLVGCSARTLICLILLALVSSPALLARTSSRVVRLDYYDRARSREVRALLYKPSSSSSSSTGPRVIVSPSLGRGRTDYAYLARCWCSQGMLVAVIEHSGSNHQAMSTCNPFKPWQRGWSGDRWRELPGSSSEALARVADVSFLIDQLEKESSLRFTSVGVAGHGCGTVTALALAGVPLRAGDPRSPVCLRDPRVAAVLAMSPQPPESVFRAQDLALAQAPVLLVVGDDSQPGSFPARERDRVYDYLPDSRRFLVQLRNGGHDQFASERGPMGGVARVGQSYWNHWLSRGAELSLATVERELGTDLLFWRSENPRVAAPSEPNPSSLKQP